MQAEKLRVGVYANKRGSILIHKINDNGIVIFSTIGTSLIAGGYFYRVATYNEMLMIIKKFNLSYIYEETGWD